jgi:hypothetical protein
MIRTLASVALAAMTADPAALQALFPSEADVFAEGPGLVRLDLPPEVTAACRPDLSDVRLFDLQGNEVPFLLEASRLTRVAATERLEARVADVNRSETSPERGPSVRHETYVLEGPTSKPKTGAWTLVLEGAPREFVAKIRVTAGPTVVETSVFRLASPRAVEKVRVPLGSGVAGELRVELQHEGATWLQPGFVFEAGRELEVGGRNTIELRADSVRREDGKTIVELSRPRGIVPEALRVASSTAAFDRAITVFDVGPQHEPEALGSGSVFRLRPRSGIEELEVPLRPARGDRLRVVVEDGDSPPLADATFTAVFGQPTLIASLSQGGPSPAAVLAFGGGRARVPRYDLAGLRAVQHATGTRAEALLSLYESQGTTVARLGPARANPAFDRSPALSFAMRAGAEIDRGMFGMTRELDVTPSAEGLSRLRLHPDDLAVLRSDAGDLRIADGSSRQWPYLVVDRAAETDVPLAIEEPRAASGRSRYVLKIPMDAAVFGTVLLDTDAPFFDRAFEMKGQRKDGSDVTLAQGRLLRSGNDRTPVRVGLLEARVVRMELLVDDGDDAPLTLTGARARAVVPDVYLAAPAGRYTLLLDAPKLTAPSYELERVREVVLAVEASEVKPGPLEKNRDYRLTAGLSQSSGRQQALFWTALVAAVVVLALLTLRLARK